MARTGHALGISVHTGWGACMVVGGSPKKPEIVANEVVDVLGDDERFCFHMAAEMKRDAAVRFLAKVRQKALVSAKRVLAPLIARGAGLCAIVAKDRDPGTLDEILAAHPRIHTAEGCFYRDVFRDACSIPVRLVPPASLDPETLGKLATKPWGKDQRLAALAAWQVLGTRTS